MNKVKHTPGPWFVCGVRQKVGGQEALGISRYNEEKRRDENIASVWYDPRNGEGTTDAHLIASAPDMREALEAFVAHYPMGTNPFLDDAFRSARAALSRSNPDPEGE